MQQEKTIHKQSNKYSEKWHKKQQNTSTYTQFTNITRRGHKKQAGKQTPNSQKSISVGKKSTGTKTDKNAYRRKRDVKRITESKAPYIRQTLVKTETGKKQEKIL